MSAITSLGIHRPAALQHLDGGKGPSETYQWHTYIEDTSDGAMEEEVLYNEKTVVWSQGNCVRALHNFELEDEDVRQAFLTVFRPHADEDHPAAPERALIVFTSSKLHIHFLQGPQHVIDLPFEIGRALPAPNGLILCRARAANSQGQSTPRVPDVPPNSFLSSQHSFRKSYTHSPSAHRGVHSRMPPHPNKGQGFDFDHLWHTTIGSPRTSRDEGDVLFTLVDPFAEPGLITEVTRTPVLRLAGKSKSPGASFEPLDPAESVVYVSSKNELSAENGTLVSAPLILIATINEDRGSLTIWHGWYLHQKSMQELMQKRDDVKAEKAKRRSSFLSASIGTGATTPAIRHRDAFRESFVAASQIDNNLLDEAAMASQLDPDFAVESMQKLTKEVSRRISSQVSRGDGVVPNNLNATYGAGSTYRRGLSFGGPLDRRSFGRRRSRESTPGSVLSRSFTVGDTDTMELESESELEVENTITDVLDMIRASHAASGSESLLGNFDEGWRRDLVVHRLHTFTLQHADPSIATADRFKAVTLKQSLDCTKSDAVSMIVYIHDKLAGQLFSCTLDIVERPLELQGSPGSVVSVPVVHKCDTETLRTDLIRLIDGDVRAIMLAGHGIRFPASDLTCEVAQREEYRIYNPYEATIDTTLANVETGRNHVLRKPVTASRLKDGSIAGRYSESFLDGSWHRQSIKLRPRDDVIDDILAVCEIVLPQGMADSIRPTWLIMYDDLLSRPELMNGTFCSTEAIAAAAVVFAQVLGLLDHKNKAALHLARVAASNRRASFKHAILTVEQANRAMDLGSRTAWSRLQSTKKGNKERDQAAAIAIALADELSTSSKPLDVAQNALVATKLILGLHISLEERRLNVCASPHTPSLAAMIILQLGLWLNLAPWTSMTGSYYELGGGSANHWAFVRSSAYSHPSLEIMEVPISVFEWLDHSIKTQSIEQYPTLPVIAQMGVDIKISDAFIRSAGRFTTRIEMLSALLKTTSALSATPQATVEAMKMCNISLEVLDSLPEGVAAPLKEAVAQCERGPPAHWSADLLHLVGRDDLGPERIANPSISIASALASTHDVQSICAAVEVSAVITKTREADRNAISQLIFSHDRRLVDATSMLHFNTVQIAECQKQPDWTDAFYFEQQKKIMQFVTVRMIALPVGDGMLHFNSQNPLMTDKYYLPGFSSSCIMQPIGHTVTTDRSGLTEEKVNWAYFHAGVSAGLRISKDATGIDTSWLMFNKPTELTNRHAGLLLALGLNGHLKSLAKWLSFKYLTPKHTMTSLGLLLGLAASHIGSMDGLITRMLSVHISCMLPRGAAELNVSPQTQTAGLLGIGLLYYNTQHRRMTETMLQEIESAAIEDPDCGPDSSKDESYRLAAGFAIGYINLGRGRELRGLNGVQIQERLLRVAVGSRPVHAVHIVDKAVAASTVAIAMMYMKSEDAAIARQIDVPDTEAQFEHIRPDILMLRTLAKHVILWKSIVTLTTDSDRTESAPWISANLPRCYWMRWSEFSSERHALKSADMPFYYIVTGLALAMSLKYAGSGHKGARNEILAVSNILWSIQKKRGEGQYYYDTKMARSAIRRCVDVLALGAATVMSGTGDLVTFRYLRRLHGRTDAETPYGSHLAAHMAIGILFMAGGTCTFGTTDLAIASLMVSLYPLFPIDVHDNKVHLQAFRHLWIFAVEPRCLVAEDIHAGKPLQMEVEVKMKDGELRTFLTPCLLPGLDTIKSVSTRDASYWPVVLDFENPEHLRRFKVDHKILVRHCPPSEAHDSMFWATFSALTMPARGTESTIRDWVLRLVALSEIDRSDIELILRAESNGSTMIDLGGTKVDDQLTLHRSAASNNSDRLWDVRVLLAWCRRVRETQMSTRWLGRQFIARLERQIDERRRGS